MFPLGPPQETAGQEALSPPGLFSSETPVGEIWGKRSPPTNLAASFSASCWTFLMVSLITGTRVSSFSRSASSSASTDVTHVAVRRRVARIDPVPAGRQKRWRKFERYQGLPCSEANTNELPLGRALRSSS